MDPQDVIDALATARGETVKPRPKPPPEPDEEPKRRSGPSRPPIEMKCYGYNPWDLWRSDMTFSYTVIFLGLVLFFMCVARIEMAWRDMTFGWVCLIVASAFTVISMLNPRHRCPLGGWHSITWDFPLSSTQDGMCYKCGEKYRRFLQ